MEYNLVTNIQSCYIDVPLLLYYSHVPTAIVSLVLAFFVFLKNRKLLVSKILLFIAIFFSLWSFFDIIIWISPDSRKVMFLWSIVNLIEMLVSVFTLYFAYAFLEKKDVPLKIKIFIGTLLLPFILLIPTKLNLPQFVIESCEAQQGPLLKYYYILEAFFSLSLIAYLIVKIIKNHESERAKTIYFSIGIILFLASFSGANIMGSILEQWEILQYGLFGMIVFLAFLSYLILKYQAFDIKVLATQFFIVASWLLIASQFFIGGQNQENLLLAVTTLLLTTVLGYIIFRSVKQEVVLAEGVRESSEKLLKINRKLEELDKAKSEFISIASHQLRTPLTSIKGFSSLLLENTFGKVPEKQKEAINKIFVNNEKLVLLVEDMLNVSRLESGRLQYDFEETEIVPLVGDVIKNLKLYAKNKKLYLKFQKPEEKLPLILADQRKLSEIIANLIDNAIKYTQKGGVRVMIESFERNQKVGKFEGTGTFDQTWIRVRVKDTGIGMKEEETVSIFEKFKKGNYAETEENGTRISGTGFGVYISRQMTHAMNGKLFAKSPGKNKGSEFILELPGIKENGK
ncbi:MAG: ATP-binding protein [Candidatus Taylorbacteria bacterium]|nr:ATP-binding protein [Candidatus Taylorbacteria bacterium]